MNDKSISIVSGYSINLPAIKNRLIPLVENLQQKGFKITIFSPCKFKLELKNNLEINYVKLNLEEDLSENLIIRAFKEIYKSFKLLNLAYNKNDKYIYIGTPSIFNLLFSRYKYKNQFLDIRDITWEYLPEKNFFSLLLKKLFTIISIKKLRNFSVITCTNNSELKYLKNKIQKKQILYYLPNGISLDIYKKVSNLKIENNNRKKAVSYIGNIGKAQNLEILIRTAKHFPNLRFNIVGHGREFKKIKKLIKDLKLKNVFLFGRVDFKKVLEVYRKSDILYTQLTSKYSMAIPSKIYEYLATGKYIIFGGNGEINNLLKNFDNYIIVDSNNIDKLRFNIEEAISKKLIDYNSNKNKLLILKKFIREKHFEEFHKKIFSK